MSVFKTICICNLEWAAPNLFLENRKLVSRYSGYLRFDFKNYLEVFQLARMRNQVYYAKAYIFFLWHKREFNCLSNLANSLPVSVSESQWSGVPNQLQGPVKQCTNNTSLPWTKKVFNIERIALCKGQKMFWGSIKSKNMRLRNQWYC